MKTFVNQNARTLDEAVALVQAAQRDGQSVSFAAGGTDLLQLVKERLVNRPGSGVPDVLVNLKSIDGLDRVEARGQGGITIGGLITLDALGSDTRRQILRLIATKPMTVGAIAQLLPVSRPAVSKHLRILEKAELVTFERQGTRSVYRLNRSGFDRARDWLDAFWDDALDRFAALAEETYVPTDSDNE